MKTNIIILTSSVIIAAAIVYLTIAIKNHGRYQFGHSEMIDIGCVKTHVVQIIDTHTGDVFERRHTVMDGQPITSHQKLSLTTGSQAPIKKIEKN